jgi:phosphoadenosine phosphosulfate reductase
MKDFYARHERVALMFSGGKDSTACLLKAAPYLADTTVVWVNPGNPYPETKAIMATLRDALPNFIEVRGNQPAFVKEHGYPVDVVPISMTSFGRAVGRTSGVRVCAYTDCCRANMWTPAMSFLKANGFTGVIRGDKSSDGLKPPLSSGQVVDGIEFFFPLEGMTDDEVVAFLGDDLPPSYQRGLKTSLDCINCTAYLHDNRDRIAALAKEHPAVHAEVTGVLRAVFAEIERYKG